MSALPKPAFDAQRNLITRGDRRLVFHCHHYNVFLQRTVEDGLGERAPALLTSAASESARAVFEDLKRGAPGTDARWLLERAAEMFASQGFGHADVSNVGPMGGRVELSASHYATGWVAKWGQRESPCCFFAAGFFGAAVAVAGGHAPERVTAHEASCVAAGHPHCAIVVEVW